MKYLRKLDESFDTKQHHSKSSSKKYTINRSELLAQIDAAMEIDDWEMVEHLMELLDETNESYLLDWKGHNLLLESMQEAKAIVQGFADREFEIAKKRLEDGEPEEISQETPDLEKDSEPENFEPGEDKVSGNKLDRLKKKIHEKYFGQTSDFEKIKRLLNFSGPVAAFTRFRYYQGADLETLTGLQRTLVNLRDNLKDLPMTLDQYSKLSTSTEDSTPGYEKLGDDLNQLLELRGGNWLIRALPREAMKELIAQGLWNGPIVNHREDFKKAPKEFQLELQREASKLNALNKPSLLKLVTKKISGKASLEAILDLVKNTIRNADTDRGKLLEKALSLYPSVNVLYSEGDYLVFSFRNDANLPFLCGKAINWCIQPGWYNKGYADRFWQYASGTVQLGILDFTVDPSNDYHTVGVTINPDGSINPVLDEEDNEIVLKDANQLWDLILKVNPKL